VIAAILLLVLVPLVVLVVDHQRGLGRATRGEVLRDSASAPSTVSAALASRSRARIPAEGLVPTSVRTMDLSAPRVARRLLPDDPVGRGVGGRYRVRVTAVDVVGSSSCQVVAARVAARPPAIEELEHVAGTPTFRFAAHGMAGHLETDGTFATDLVRGVTRGITWSARMTGAFAGDSMVATSETETTGVLRWRDTQSCRTVASLVATRIEPVER
jgi:hypothetical protein